MALAGALLSSISPSSGTLLVLAGVDLDHKMIPDASRIRRSPHSSSAASFLREVRRSICWSAWPIGYGVVAVTAELAILLGRDGMGYGDAKLLMLIGALLGWRAVAFTFFLSPFFGLRDLVPVLPRASAAACAGVEVPYGPFLVAAALVYLFFGRTTL